jgi:tRNA (cmo5U34)-methyltransferase
VHPEGEGEPRPGRPTLTRLPIPADWTFEHLGEGFDRHVREQLPWYDVATGLVAHVARAYVPEGGLVYDLGASTGNVGRALAPTLEARGARLVAIEREPEMKAAYEGPGEFIAADVLEYEYEPFDVAVAFLLFMFVPPARRERLLFRLTTLLREGGAIVIVDKDELPGGYLGTVLRRLTLAGKVATGTPAEEIVAKELSLSGVQRPASRGWPRGGVEVFRFGEFAGWVVEKVTA